MELSEIKKAAPVKKVAAASLRVKPETRKRVLAELAKVNKKSFGRKVRVDQLLELLLTLVKPAHVEKMQSDSLSNSDRIEMRYREHIKRFGTISKDDFLGKILNGEISKSRSEIEEKADGIS